MSDNPVFSYTKRDYSATRQEGLSQIPVLSKGAWTDLNATDPGIIILDYVHALVDMVNYYQDHQALEAFITTSKERVNIFRLAKQLSYKIRSSKGATTTVTFDSLSTYTYSIKIPKYTPLSTNTDIPYLTKEDAYLSPGSTRVEIPCVQGSINTMTYVGTNISRFSDENSKNQSITLSTSHIDTETISISDNSGVMWKEVDYIIFSSPNEKVYQLELNPDDSVTIKFGDGERGFVPRVSDTLTITYMSNLANAGSVGIGAITKLTNPIRDMYSNVIPFTVYNLDISTGGSTSQSSREITELAPGVIKSQGRAVTLLDFESLAKQVEGVSDAKAYDINTAPDLCLHHEVKVVIVPKVNVSNQSILSGQVYDYLYQRMLPPTNLQVLTPSRIPVDISVVVKEIDAISTEGGLDYEIQEAIERYFNERLNAVGESFYPSDLMAIISRLEEVRYVISLTPSSIITPEKLSLVVLGNLHIEIQ